jgi:hypothetical protein
MAMAAAAAEMDIEDNSVVEGGVAMMAADTVPLETSTSDGEVPMHEINGNSASAPPILTKTSLVALGSEVLPLHTLKTKIQLMASIPGQRYVMGVFPNAMNRNRLIVDTLVLRGGIVRNSTKLLLSPYNKKCDEYRALINERIDLIRRLTNKASGSAKQREYHNTGVISHSRCVVGTIGGIRQIMSYRLPPNVEIITINTLGYSTYGGTLKHAWDTFYRYLISIPIEILKQYCPGIRSEKNGGHEYLPAPAMVAAGTPLGPEDISFINSVKASLRYKFTDIPKGKLRLDDLRKIALKNGEPEQISGRQELFENLLNRFL